jgi:UDP-glucuronate decarboxylase
MHPNDGRVVSNFIVQALKSEDITICGNGRQTRSFCYVDDLVHGMIMLMATEDGVTGPINLGNPHELSIRELAGIVLDLTGSRSRLIDAALPANDPQQRQPDISMARTVLEWEPRVPLREGLMKTIRYFDELLGSGAIRA